MMATYASCLMVLMAAMSTVDAGAYYYSPDAVSYSGSYLPRLSQPLTILPERPFAAADSLSPTPLYVLPRTLVRILDPKAVSASYDATPGVRVVLRRPLIVSAPSATISFPSEFTVDQEPGVRGAMNVGAVIAPVSSINYPITVRIVYAIATLEPSGFYPSPYGLPQYYYDYPQYAYQTALAVPQKPYSAPAKPESPTPTTAVSIDTVSTEQRPVDSADETEGQKEKAPQAGEPQLVTVLDFPTAVAEPASLFFQPPLTGEELGNREPPQAIAPAGIVQSAAPIPNLSVFVNSKESPYLQVLRDEALRVRSPQRTPTYVIHGDTVQVDAL